MKLKKYTLIAALALPMAAAAQTASVTFDTDDYKAVSVYDSWENSPFRKGTLQGNVAVIDNHLNQVDDFLGEAPNSTAKILGVQRSRFGSNQFGARIDLKTPFSLSPTPQYVHVLINRPIEGRVMLMGLGKHREPDWAGQSPETEQFWEISTTSIKPNKWTDAVFGIKGVSGVDIYSLVVVPECESPHERNQDFVAYIDQIVVNTSPAPLLQYDDYPTNFDKKSTKATRNDRGIKTVSLAGKTVNVSSDPSSGDPVYRDMMENTFPVKAGQEVTASMTIEGTWMNSYLYIDYGQDGKFSYGLNANGTPAEGSDIKTFSNYNGKNSRGVTNSSNNTLAMPSFTIPAGTPKGFYRMRFKDDWSDIDPGGAPTIVSNGGGIVDVRLNVHEDFVSVTEDNRNGEVLSGDGSALMTTTPFGQAFTVKLNPENGFAYNGMRVRHGYNLDGDKLIRGTLQYVDDIVYSNAFDENDCYTIPAEWVDGDIVIEGLFVEKGTEISYDYLLNLNKDTTISRTDRYLNAVTMAGKRVDIANDKKVYHEDMSQTFFVAPGDEMTPTFGYAGGPMHGYVYIDKNQNGIFDTGNITNGVIGENSDAMTFSFWSGNNTNGQSGYNSNGVNLTGSARNVLNPPSFIIPNLADGFYRIRFKVDWNEIDAGGNVTSNNHIISNGGGIADYRLRVFSGSEVNVNVISEYGEVLNVSNETLDGTTVPFNEALTLKVVPFAGCEIEGITVRHGALNASQATIHSVPQVLTTTYTSADISNGVLTLPAEIVDGDLEITVNSAIMPCYKMNLTAAAALEDTLYVLSATSNKGVGYVYYDTSASGRKYRANISGIDFSDKVTDLNYVWRLKKNNDGTTFTLQNLANPSVYFVADTYRNANFSGTETANLVWNSNKTMHQTNYTNGSNILYIHENKANNTPPNLSYWDSNGAIGTAGTCVVFDFYRVNYVQPANDSTMYTVTYNYMLDGQVKLTTQTDVRNCGLLPPIEVPDYVTATRPVGIVYNNMTVDIPCTLNLPFEISDDLQKHYYFLKLGTGGTYDPIRYVDDGDASKTVLQTNITEVDKGCVWYFKGDPFSGIRLYNAQADKVLITSTTMSGTTGGGTYPRLADANAALASGYTNLWDISPTAYSGISDGFNLKIHGGTNEYINYRNGNLAFWTNDAATTAGGSVLRVIKDVPAISLNDGGDGYYYATTYLPFATDVPANSNVAAYAAVLNSRGTGIELSDPLTAIPANSGVILKSASASTLTLTLSDETLAALPANVLQGSCEAIALTDANRSNYLILGKSTTDGKPGFYKPSSAVSSIRANRAYILVSSLPAAAATRLAFDDMSITGINGIATSSSTEKVFYDLQGRRVNRPQKGGVYIRNGKKVIW